MTEECGCTDKCWALVFVYIPLVDTMFTHSLLAGTLLSLRWNSRSNQKQFNLQRLPAMLDHLAIKKQPNVPSCWSWMVQRK